MDASRIPGVGDGGAEGATSLNNRLLLTDFTCSMRRRSTYTAEGDDATDEDHAAVLDETGPSVTLAPWDLSSLEALLAHTPCLYGLAQNAIRTRGCSLRSPARGISGSPAIPSDSRHA